MAAPVGLWLALACAPATSAAPQAPASAPVPTPASAPVPEASPMLVEIRSVSDFAAATAAYGRATELEVRVAPGVYEGASLGLSDPFGGGPRRLVVRSDGATVRGAQWSLGAGEVVIEGLAFEGASLEISAGTSFVARKVGWIGGAPRGGGSVGGVWRLTPRAAGATARIEGCAIAGPGAGLVLADGPGPRFASVTLVDTPVVGSLPPGIDAPVRPGPPTAADLAAARAFGAR